MSDDQERREQERQDQERRYLEQLPLRYALEALRRCEHYINRLVGMDPILHIPDGDRCAFGSGYGTWDGVEDEVEIPTHRPDCLWDMATRVLRKAEDHHRHWEKVKWVPVPQPSPEEYKRMFGQYPPDHKPPEQP